MNYSKIRHTADVQREAAEQTFRRILSPKLDELMDSGAEKNIEINGDKLCVNGVAIGKYRKIKNIRVADDLLMFDYGAHKRCVSFGFRVYNDCDRVRMILQDDKAIYSDFSTGTA